MGAMPVAEGTGVAGVDTIAVWSVAITAVVGLLGILIRVVSQILKAMTEFMEDWRGEAGRPGVPPRPGVMERMRGTETRTADVEKRVDGVELRVDGLERTVGRIMLDGCGDGGSGEGLLGGRGRSTA